MQLKNLFITFIISIILSQNIFAQTKGLVVDIESRQPIPYVSIFTKTDDRIFGAMSNENGQFNFDFTFNLLYFSHINYDKIVITKLQLNDTVYLTPTTTILKEIVVNNKQPEWINKVLKKVIVQKSQNYHLKENMLSYKYETYTLNDSNGYAFSSSGNLLIPQLKKMNLYMIDAQNNTIKYKDNTAGVDFSNLKRMLYGDFVSNLEPKFIKENRFSQNYSFDIKNKNIVQLFFTSKKFQDDNGYIVIDTLNCVILEIERNSGTEYNIKTQTNSVLRNFISSKAGFNYNNWITQVNTKYQKIGKCYYIAACKYKFYMKTTTMNKKVNSNYFTSIESELVLNNEIKTKSINLKAIPKPYYLVAIMTKKMQDKEDSLNKIPVRFVKF